MSMTIGSARGGGVKIEASGASVDTLYRAHLAAYGPRDGATQEVYEAVRNRRPSFTVEADASELLGLVSPFQDMGLWTLARELLWHESLVRANELRDEASAIEDEANAIERGRRG